MNRGWLALLLGLCLGGGTAAEEYRIEVRNVQASPHPASALLGVHSLWWGHQASLMTATGGSTHPAVIDWLRAAGGLVRFGGGINEQPWAACAAPLSERRAYKVVNWAEPQTCRFGIPEYLRVLRQAGIRTGWVMANLRGVEDAVWSAPEMRNEAARAAGDFAVQAKDFHRVWELGNELDRGRHLWSPEYLAERASIAGQAIRTADPASKLIVPMMDYDHPRQPRRTEYNERLLRALSVQVDGVAHHIYYDGSHGGPPIPTQLKPITDTAALYRQLKGRPAEIWVTEHGRWPDGRTEDPAWNKNWYQTNDMSGVLGGADFLIALSQIEDVAGAMLHGLRAGPWNAIETIDGVPRPTGVGQLLALFGSSGAQARLKTVSVNPSASSYRGGYDMRAAAFTTRARGETVLWVVNRAPRPIRVALVLPTLLTAEVAEGLALLCPQPDGRCSGRQFAAMPVSAAAIEVGAKGIVVSLPEASVSVLRLTQP